MTLVTCLLSVLGACSGGDAPVRSVAIDARLELAAGDVRSGQGTADVPVYTGAALSGDAALATGPGARAMARLSDGTAVFLRENSTLTLVDGGVAVTAGEVFVEAADTEGEPVRHQLGTAVVSGVDAGFSMRLDGGAETVVMARGTAVVTGPKGRVELHAGEQAQLVDGAPVTAPVAYWEDWTGGLADHHALTDLSGAGTGRIYGVRYGGSPGAAAAVLETREQTVHVTVRSGVAETEVDQTFFNPSQSPLEGWYWFTVPDGALVTGFAVETNGVLVDGEFVEKTRAATGYARGVSSGHQPALLEWVNERTARARIFPVPAMGSRRVVLRYLQELPTTAGTLRYVYPLRSDDPAPIGEFALTVDLGAEGRTMQLATSSDARVEDGGERITVRRSGFVPRADFQLEALLDEEPAPVRVSRFRTDERSADYVMVRYTPDLDWVTAGERTADVVVVVDTSAGADEASRRLEAATVEAVLRALSSADRFALVAVDVAATALHPATGLAPSTEEEISKALERLGEHAHGGATDLSASFDVALELLHEAHQPAVVYVGDGLATSGERSGAALREGLRRSLSTSEARVFTVAVGAHADPVLLGELARTGGGLGLRVDDAVDATEQALRLTAAIKTPTVTDLKIGLGAGLDEVFESGGGKVSYGEEVVVLGRTHHPFPEQVTITGRLGGQAFSQTYPVTADDPLIASFVPKLWARASVDRMLGGTVPDEQLWGTVARVGVEYGLLTPYSSLLALDSEAAYAQLGIPRGGTFRGLHLNGLTREQEAAIRGSAWLSPLGCGVGSAPSEAPPPMVATVPEAVSSPMPSPAAASGMDGAGGRNELGSLGSQGVASDGPLAEAKSVRQGARAASAPRREVQDEKGEAVAEKRAKDGSGQERAAGCSDLASRPLADRVQMWWRRLRDATTAEDLLSTIEVARASCELSDWRAESTLVELVAARIHTEGDARTVLAGSAGPARQHLARTLLRRSTDPRIVAAVEELAFRASVDWVAVDRAAAEARTPEDRLRVLRDAVAAAPDDPRGAIRLLRALARAGQAEELLVWTHGLRERGVVTTEMAREIGDLLAAEGHTEDAIRAYSELVEFQPDRPESRRLLGDIYLSHGWYEQAYRQFETIERQDALSSLRLAIAAGGAGRVDEALRLERAVASAPGAPGADDPRTWARLWSAARLASLLQQPPPAGTALEAERLQDSLRRKLKEQQFFAAPGSLVIVSWEDLGADVVVRSYRDGKPVSVGDRMDGAAAGVGAVLLAPPDAAALELRAELRSPPSSRPIRLTRVRIRFDGSGFVFDTGPVVLAAGETSVTL